MPIHQFGGSILLIEKFCDKAVRQLKITINKTLSDLKFKRLCNY
jgi:hypothetical protein